MKFEKRLQNIKFVLYAQQGITNQQCLNLKRPAKDKDLNFFEILVKNLYIFISYKVEAPHCYHLMKENNCEH